MALMTVSLPKGELGVDFEDTTPPSVSSLLDGSPMKGKLKPGYIFHTLFLENGTELTGMKTNRAVLMQKLSSSSEEEGRKMEFCMCLPTHIKVKIPPGDHSITIDGEPPMITAITHTSSLRDTISIGLAVDSIALEDGTEYKGYLADEIKAIMEDNGEDSIVMGLKNPAATSLSTRETMLPNSKEITLPTGELGTIFQGSSSQISEMTPESPMRRLFRIGMVVDKLSLPDGTEYTRPKAPHLSKTLDSTSEIEGRVLYLKNPGAPDIETTKLPLPAGDLGLTFSGLPATIDEVAENSPLAGKVWAGQLVDTIVLENGALTYEKVDGNVLMDILQESAESEGRLLLLTNPNNVEDEIEVTPPGPPPFIAEVSPIKKRKFTHRKAKECIPKVNNQVRVVLDFLDDSFLLSSPSWFFGTITKVNKKKKPSKPTSDWRPCYTLYCKFNHDKKTYQFDYPSQGIEVLNVDNATGSAFVELEDGSRELAYHRDMTKLALGDLVDCQYQGGIENGQFFRARVAAIDLMKKTCDVVYYDRCYERNVPIDAENLCIVEQGQSMPFWLVGCKVPANFKKMDNKQGRPGTIVAVWPAQYEEEELMLKIAFPGSGFEFATYAEVVPTIFAAILKSTAVAKVQLWPTTLVGMPHSSRAGANESSIPQYVNATQRMWTPNEKECEIIDLQKKHESDHSQEVQQDEEGLEDELSMDLLSVPDPDYEVESTCDSTYSEFIKSTLS